uniref:ATP synthase F0 subunit 8 n=1 Tax=Amicula sp. isolate GU52X-4 cfCalB7 TaxID=3003489 RepID=A0A9E8Z2I7_9STRA|nr:ATP synthase F0 subunit 8 [Amicula sp. isolate GU52X-4 cfCalB7]
MAQFDPLIIFPLISSLLIILIFHYSLVIEMLIPFFSEAKKFRNKKLFKFLKMTVLNENCLNTIFSLSYSNTLTLWLRFCIKF